MLRLPGLLCVLSIQFFGSRHDLLLENLAHGQQFTVLKRQHPQPRFVTSDRLFWVALRRLWCEWKQALILVEPKTVGAGIG
jgi:hypothetical protein